MKKIFSRNITNKVLIFVLIVLLINFIVPTYSQADFGGVLFDPLVDLISSIGDVLLAALQYFMYDGNVSLQDQSLFALTIPNLAFSANDFNVGLSTEERDALNNGNLEIYKINEDTLDDTSWWSYIGAAGNLALGNILFSGKTTEEIITDTVVMTSPYGIPIVRYSPEEIFSNQVPALDVNFITPRQWEGDTQEATDAMNERSVTQILQETIAGWYVVLRNLAIIGLLSVLLYVGIRMVISSTAADKAKYKQMLMDWVVALCILFFLHYMMSFILTFVEILVDGISSATSDVVVGIYTDETYSTLVTNINAEELVYKTDLTGLCRLQVQSKDLSVKLVYLIFYIALVIYTIMFTWIYIKRAITMAFLTLVAPLVSITYPIDKMRDGQAQAFNIWLKEYVFNALLQPFHLIIYTVFLGSSMSIAATNPIYAILFLAFIIPSEKLLRRMFGFDNSETAGGMSTAMSLFGGAAVLNGASRLVNRFGRGNSKKGNNDTGGRRALRTKNNTADPNTPSLTSAFGVGNRSNQQALSQHTQTRNRNLNENNRQTNRNNRNLNSPNSSPARYTRAGRNETQNLATNVSAQNPNKPKRTIKGVTGVIGHMTGGAAKFAGRAAVTGLGAGVGATIGLAAGIAGGDLDDVISSAATGTALGGGAAHILGDSASNLVTEKIPNMANDIRNTYEVGAYGEVEAALRAQTREFVADSDYQQQIAMDLQGELGRTPSSSELKNAMYVGAEYYNAGITDAGQISKAMKTEQDIKKNLKDQLINQGLPEQQAEMQAAQKAREQSKVITKMANKISATDLRNKEQEEAIRKSIEEQLFSKAKTNSMSKQEQKKIRAEAAEQSKNVIQLIKKQKGI